MEHKLENSGGGLSKMLWGVVAAVLTAGLVISLVVMLYALVSGLSRRLHG